MNKLPEQDSNADGSSADSATLTPSFDGCWYIASTEKWRKTELNAMGPAYISFFGQEGSIGIGDITAALDCRYESNRVEFSFVGEENGRHRTGRGWACMAGDKALAGKIFFHAAGETTFVAERASTRTDRKRRR